MAEHKPELLFRLENIKKSRIYELYRTQSNSEGELEFTKWHLKGNKMHKIYPKTLFFGLLTLGAIGYYIKCDRKRDKKEKEA